MKIRPLFVFLLLPALAAAQEAAAPPVAVSYTLDVTDPKFDPKDPKSGVAKVEMVVENNPDDEVTLGLPVWEPGRYRVVDFHLGIKDLEAEVDGKKTEVTATDHKSLWKVKTGGAGTFKVRYSLKPSEVPQLRGQFTADHYDLLGPSAWLYLKGRMNGPHQVTFKLPEGWKAASGLRKLSENTFGERDYDTFADCPIELGKFARHDFEHGGVKYEIVVHAAEPYDEKKLVDVHRTIVAEQMRMFGGAPFDRYVFLYHFHQGMGGNGLEHLNSTRIFFSMNAIKADPARIASLTSHEFFHLWNVKRIRPKELGPFDYTQPVRSKALWLSEGVTSYYGDLTLARAGLWTREVYLNHLAAEITQLQSTAARKTQTVEEASRTVWDRAYGSRAGAVDYYNKGELLGWLIDFKIRQATKGKRTFDDVMRHLYRTHVVEPATSGKTGPIGVGFEEDGILKAVNEVSGSDYTEFFSKYVSGTEELPYEDLLRPAGMSLLRRKTLALVLRNLELLADPPKNSAAAAAGLKKGDRIVKLNGKDVGEQADLEKALDVFNVGDKVTVHFTRKDVEKPLRVDLPIAEGSYVIRVQDKLTDGQETLLKSWLAPSK